MLISSFGISTNEMRIHADKPTFDLLLGWLGMWWEQEAIYTQIHSPTEMIYGVATQHAAR